MVRVPCGSPKTHGGMLVCPNDGQQGAAGPPKSVDTPASEGVRSVGSDRMCAALPTDRSTTSESAATFERRKASILALE